MPNTLPDSIIRTLEPYFWLIISVILIDAVVYMAVLTYARSKCDTEREAKQLAWGTGWFTAAALLATGLYFALPPA